MATEWGSHEWYDERWQDMPPVMRKLAADSVRKVLKEEDQILILQKIVKHGMHDWIHYLIDTTPEEREQMNALLPEDKRDDPEFQWPETMSGHTFFGMGIRNMLRSEEFGAGIRDDDLPAVCYPCRDCKDDPSKACSNCHLVSNWDDYYVQAIEAAVGARAI